MDKSAIRKVVSFVEDTLMEGGRASPRPVRMVGCAAVIRNPWTGSFSDNLRPEIVAHAGLLAEVLVPRLLREFSHPDDIEAYGKSAVVGVNGEVEHAAAMIHTLRFGNAVRTGTMGDAFMSFTNKRNAPGGGIVIPLTHKRASDRSSRAHFMTLEFAIPDAPAPDEIVVAIAAADGGRPHARIGNRFEDMQEMGVDQTGAPLSQVVTGPQPG